MGISFFRNGLFIVLLLTAIAWSHRQFSPVNNVFSGVESGTLLNLAGLPSSEFIHLKIDSMISSPRFGYTVLGNSRTINLTAGDLGVVPGSFFNLSGSGTSFRDSVIMIERLSQFDKLPEVLLVSFDNAVLMHYSNPIIIISDGRWRNLWYDIVRGIRDDETSLVDLARMARRHFLSELKHLKIFFDRDQILNGLRWNLGLLLGNEPVAQTINRVAPYSRYGYDRFGSRIDKKTVHTPKDRSSAEAPVPKNIYTNPHNIIYSYLKDDLRRLSAATHGKSRVILFETPVYSMEPYATETELLRSMKTVREILKSECLDHGLTCHSFALPGKDVIRGEWVDFNHPSAKGLGEYLGRLIRQAS